MPRLALTVNGTNWSGDVPAGVSLLELLREHAGLTGPKLGCGEAQCGSCTVLLDGQATAACVTSASTVAQKRVVTIEGLAVKGRLHPVQQAFIDAQAFQCGFCTPGMILGAVALLARNAAPSDNDIKQALEQHLCRCGTYPRIVHAVRTAAATIAAEARRG